MTHQEAVALHGAERTMRAHQYLYYVLNLPVISDYEFDKFCAGHSLFGGGGSDRADDYAECVKLIAEEMR